MKNKVSIIIPVFNGAKYLSQAIQSALDQTHRNIEVIVVNDGSDDAGATEQVAKSFGNLVLYFEKANGGVASALNFGIKKASGDYFAWLSHDDIFLPNKIKDQLISITKDSVIFSDFFLADENLNIVNFFLDKSYMHIFPLWLLISKQMHGCTVLAPMKLIAEFLFNEDLKVTQDYDLWFRLSKQYKFIYINKKTIISRAHKDQHSNNLSKTEVDEIKSLNALLLNYLLANKKQFVFPGIFGPFNIYYILTFRLSILGDVKSLKNLLLHFIRFEFISKSCPTIILTIFYLILFLFISSLSIIISYAYFNLFPSYLKLIILRYWKILKP